MSYYTERHGLRASVNHTDILSIEMYSMLYDCCSKYFLYIAWKYPEECPDGYGCCGLSYEKFNVAMKFEIPGLYRNQNGIVDKPQKDYYGDDVSFDQYALLDLIEMIANEAKDIASQSWHGFFHHDDLTFAETREKAKSFRAEINSVFMKTGLLYCLADSGMVERIIENSPLTNKIAADAAQVKEKGLRELLLDAISLFKTPRPAARKDAVEKIWDALERLKTYYATLDKKRSVEKIVHDMADGKDEFMCLFGNEFSALTKIGNDFRIRHHETNKTDITDYRHYDYFFNRCLSLLALALTYLN